MQRQRLRASFGSVRSVLDDITVDLDAYDAEQRPHDEDPQSITGQFPTVEELINTQPTLRLAPAVEVIEVIEVIEVVDVVEVVDIDEPAVAATSVDDETEPVPFVSNFFRDDSTDEVEVVAVQEVVEVVEIADVVAVDVDDVVDEDVVAAEDADVVEVVAVEEVVEEVVGVVEIADVVEMSESDAPLTPTARHRVDEVFARIRAGRSDVVAQLQESPDNESNDEATADADASTEATDDVDVFAERTAALSPPIEAMNRRLKRVLADEQSDVFDQLKKAKTFPTLEGLVGEVTAHVERYTTAIRTETTNAALVGARSLNEEATDVDVSVVDRALDELGAELVAPLRERLDRCLVDSGGDASVAAELLRSTYRDVKLNRIDTVIEHVALVAHGRGALGSVALGRSVCWKVDPARPCADGDDNVLGGAVAVGEAFPTGHGHAPAYFGCRCAIVTAG